MVSHLGSKIFQDRWRLWWLFSAKLLSKGYQVGTSFKEDINLEVCTHFEVGTSFEAGTSFKVGIGFEVGTSL